MKTYQTDCTANTWKDVDGLLYRHTDGEMDGVRIVAKRNPYMLKDRPCVEWYEDGVKYHYWIFEDTIQDVVNEAERILEEEKGYPA